VPAVRALGGAVEWTTVAAPRADAERAVRRVHDGDYVDMVKRRARSSLFGECGPPLAKARRTAARLWP
jgi:hypothetical protein